MAEFAPGVLERLMGAIRNIDWTQWMQTFIVCGTGRGLRLNAMALVGVGSLSRISPSLEVFARAVVPAFAGAVPRHVRTPENCPPFGNRSYHDKASRQALPVPVVSVG
jgi:hypothetical protein